MQADPEATSSSTLAVGTLHGLAGGSHFLGVVPALALSTSQAVLYLVAYGLGTVTATIQGLIQDRCSKATKPFSVTNGVVLIIE